MSFILNEEQIFYPDITESRPFRTDLDLPAIDAGVESTENYVSLKHFNF